MKLTNHKYTLTPNCEPRLFHIRFSAILDRFQHFLCLLYYPNGLSIIHHHSLPPPVYLPWFLVLLTNLLGFHSLSSPKSFLFLFLRPFRVCFLLSSLPARFVSPSSLSRWFDLLTLNSSSIRLISRFQFTFRISMICLTVPRYSSSMLLSSLVSTTLRSVYHFLLCPPFQDLLMLSLFIFLSFPSLRIVPFLLHFRRRQLRVY